jgi:putative flippase GtrA
LRFLISGTVNTCVSLVLYWALLLVTHYLLAYTASVAFGIVISYLLNSRFVFRVRASARSALLFPLVYGVQYLIGVLVLWIWTDALSLPPRFGILATIAVTIPVTFVMSRVIFKTHT